LPFCLTEWFVSWVRRVVHASRADYLFWLERTAATLLMVRSCLLPFLPFVCDCFVAGNAGKV
jgi:hypothetical protein